MNIAQFLADYFDRAKSHIYGVFLGCAFLIHIPVVFVALFVDQNLIYEKTKLLKNEYIHAQFFNFSEWWMWLVYAIGVIALSCLMTWLIIWVFPKTIIKRAYSRELQDQYDRDSMKLAKESELEKIKARIAKSQESVAVAEERVVKTKARTENIEKQSWVRDYTQFKNSRYFEAFRELIQSIYEHAGYVKADYNSMSGVYRFELDPDLLAYTDSLGLIDFRQSDKNIDRIAFTEKGKYFVRKYRG